MKKDLNKGINITYNYLNLPVTITWNANNVNDKRKIEWLYDATGSKLRKTVYNTDGEATMVTDYVNGFVYNTNDADALPQLSFFSMSEGRVVNLGGSYELQYWLKDHLGSTRMVLNSSNQIDSRYNYAPFGRVMYSSVTTDVAYKFTGQEYDDENGLHNFRARLYDAEIGMFYAYDPAAQGFSPFGYAGNNPVIRIDKNGKFWHLIIGAIIGGVLNAVMNSDDIHNFGDFAAYFGVGALSGAVGAGIGSGITASLSGASFWGGFIGSESAISAISSSFYSGFYSGLQIGAGSGAASGFISGFGNSLVKGENIGKAFGSGGLNGLIGGVSGGIVGGLSSGIEAAIDGRNFWYGDRLIQREYFGGFKNYYPQLPGNTDCVYHACANAEGYLTNGNGRSVSDLIELGGRGGGLTDPFQTSKLVEKMGYDAIFLQRSELNKVCTAMFFGDPVLLSYQVGPNLGYMVVINEISIYNSGRFSISVINSVIGAENSFNDLKLIQYFLQMKRK